MKNPKLTEWFDGSKFVPAHVGVYEIKLTKRFNGWVSGNGTFYSHWNGYCWSYIACDLVQIIEYGYDDDASAKHPDFFTWRGLAVKP